MQRVLLPGSARIETSPLGFGCASLGSRYGAAAGLRSLEEAFARGITWFDVAPAYGAGAAELILARFIADKRDQVQLCTKVGLAAPRQGLSRQILMPLARPMLAKIKGARGVVRRSGTTANTREPLTAATIQASIARSLSQLNTDRVEVYALHSPALEDVTRDDVLRALEQVLERGQARMVAVAGDTATAVAGARCGTYGLVQLADFAADRVLLAVRAAASAPLAIVTHSILGTDGSRAALEGQLAAEPLLMDEARSAGFGTTPGQAAAQLLMARAFANNAGGVVLASMFKVGHLDSNIAAAELAPDKQRQARALVERCFAQIPK